MTLKQTVTEKVDEVRLKRPFVDHIRRMQKHYSAVQGGILAGAVTYFAFLSIFPMLAIAFAAVGIVARVYPSAQTDLETAIGKVLPGVIGSGGISLDQIQSAAGTALGIGGLTLLYSGLGWLSNLRTAMQEMFLEPQSEKPSFVVGKLKDLVALITLGVVLILSVLVSQVVTSLSNTILGWLGLGTGLSPLVWVLGILVGVGASTVLFYMFFKVLADPPLVPKQAMWQGALLGAILFAVLQQLSSVLLRSTQKSPAFQAFGIALVLLVWIYYFSRVLMYSAAFAQTDSESVLLQQQKQAREDSVAARNTVRLERKSRRAQRPARVRTFLAGSLSAVVALAAVRRRRSES